MPCADRTDAPSGPAAACSSVAHAPGPAFAAADSVAVPQGGVEYFDPACVFGRDPGGGGGRGGDVHAASVGPIAVAAYQVGAFEPVEDSGDGAGAQAGE